MASYKHLLLAVDFSDETDQITKRAVAIAQCFKAKMTFLHVIEGMETTEKVQGVPPLAPGVAVPPPPTQTPVESQTEGAMEQAQNILVQMTESLEIQGLDTEKLVIHSTSTKDAIHQIAKETNVDLIVVGTHGRHGLSLLLSSSTSSSVLHDAPCDVLAVRIVA